MMSMVARYAAAFAASALAAAFACSAQSGFSPDLFLTAHFWIISICLTGLAGLAMGQGIGAPAPRRRRLVVPVPAAPMLRLAA